MPITGEYNSNKLYGQYGTFGALTNGQSPVNTYVNNASHQAYGMPSTLPGVIGIPSVEDMERASQIAQVTAANPFMSTERTKSEKYVPVGDGELHPIYGDDEHKLEFFA